MDHYTTIDLNKDELIKRIELQHGLLWDKLLELGVVDPIAAQSFRDEIKDDRSQVKALLSYIQKQPASQYLIFREALKATGQDHIVKKYLPLEPRLPEGLRLKLAQKYLSTYRNIILWGSGVNPQAVKFDAVYTDMAWKTADTSARKNLEHYTDMLKKDNQCQYRRICVWGDAGIGKSVFTAKLCQDWALVVTAEQTDLPTVLSKEQRDSLNKLSHEQRAILWNIDVLLCIILRDVNEAQNLSHIIESQLILKENETDTIMKFFESKPRSALLVLDGLDEIRLNEQDKLFTTLTGISYPEVGYIVTCRPFAAHGIKLVVDAQVELCGFNEAQANAYILAYYHMKFPDKNKEQIKKEASICWDKISASQDLLEMAMNPSMLQLMCLLYTENGKIGKDRTQVFEEYTRYLLVQYHKKYKRSIAYKDEIYHKDLMTLGNLALSGLHQNHFQLIFLKSKITEKHDDMPFKMGFLTELPSNEAREPKAQFLHKSLQEYLAAYFIVNSQEDEGVAYLMKFCSTSSNLMSSQMIISFISVMSKKMGKIVQEKVRDMISEWEKKDEVSPADRLSFLYTMLKNNKAMKFPLPKEINMNVASYESKNKVLYNLKRFFSGPSTLVRLFEMDSSGVMRISVVLGRNSRLSLFRSFKWTQVVHIELDFEGTTGPDDGNEIEKIIKSAAHTTVLVIKNYGEFEGNEKHHRNMFEGLAKSLSSLTNLDTLEITECYLRADDIERIAENMKESNKLTKLRLAHSYFLRGAAVGRLLQRTPSLQLLDVWCCDLSIPALLQAAGRAVLTNLLVLDLGRNYDRQMGLSGYLASMPRLQALSVATCGCNDVQDLLHLVASLPPTLTHLNVCNYFGPSVVEVLQHKERLARLHRLNIGWYGEVRSIKEELQRLNPQLLVYYDDGERLWDMYKDTTQDT